MQRRIKLQPRVLSATLVEHDGEHEQNGEADHSLAHAVIERLTGSDQHLAGDDWNRKHSRIRHQWGAVVSNSGNEAGAYWIGIVGTLLKMRPRSRSVPGTAVWP